MIHTLLNIIRNSIHVIYVQYMKHTKFLNTLSKNKYKPNLFCNWSTFLR